MNLWAHNTAKIQELRPEVQWAGFRWLESCREKGLQFKILEAYRTPERQKYLYTIGRRGVPGERPVTYTLQSNHTRRLAVDILPINCTYEDVAAVAAWYGITHPISWDRPHLEFNRVGPEPRPKTRRGIEALLRRAIRKADRMSRQVKEMIFRRVERAIKRLHD